MDDEKYVILRSLGLLTLCDTAALITRGIGKSAAVNIHMEAHVCEETCLISHKELMKSFILHR